MLFIFDSHPVQYKAPVYQELQRLRPGGFKVIYATDCSVRGHQDRDFGQRVAWDTPLMEGYPHMVLHNERGDPLHGFRSLTGRGIFTLLKRERPAAALISQFLYASDLTAYIGGDYIYRGKYYADAANITSSGDSELFNARLGLRKGNYNIELFARNLFDDTSPGIVYTALGPNAAPFSLPSVNGANIALPDRRRVGIRVSAAF